MSAAESISLLGFVNTPILVGDPEGRIVYANPSFQKLFCPDSDDVMGEPLAAVFGGGSREVVLSALAAVLDRGETAKLQIRENGVGYLGLASPIEAQDDRVGVVMVLLEEPSSARDHLPALVDELAEPIAEAASRFATMASELGPMLHGSAREQYEEGAQALDDAQQSHRELNAVVRGGKPKQGNFNLSASIQRVMMRIGGAGDAESSLEVLMPTNLPSVHGTASAFERLMGQLVRQRMDERRDGQPLTLLARCLSANDRDSVLISLVDVPDANRRGATGHPPEAFSQGIAAMGGEALCVEDSAIGRVTSIRLAVAAA